MPGISLENLLDLKTIRNQIEERKNRIFRIFNQHRDKNSTQEKLVNAIENLIDGIDKIKQLAFRGLDEVRKIEKDYQAGSDIRKGLKNLDYIDRSILRNSNRNIASFLLHKEFSRLCRLHR